MAPESNRGPLLPKIRRTRRGGRNTKNTAFRRTRENQNNSQDVLIAPSIAQMNAAVDWYKQESQRHQIRADQLEKKVKDLEARLDTKSALQRNEIIRAFEMIGSSALKEKIGEAFTADIVSKTIERVMGRTLTVPTIIIKDEKV